MARYFFTRKREAKEALEETLGRAESALYLKSLSKYCRLLDRCAEEVQGFQESARGRGDETSPFALLFENFEALLKQVAIKAGASVEGTNLRDVYITRIGLFSEQEFKECNGRELSVNSEESPEKEFQRLIARYAQQFPDNDVKQAAGLAYSYRNFKAHVGGKIPGGVAWKMLTTLIVALHRKIDEITEYSGTRVRNRVPLDDTEAARRVREKLELCKDGLDGNLEGFVGRESYLRMCEEWLEEHQQDAPDRKTGKYLLIQAEGGMGKSAVLSKLVARRMERYRGGPGSDPDAPVWLPNCLLLFGKQEKSPVQIVKLLVAQANCLLAEDYPLDTIGMPDREGRGEPSLPKKERKQGGLEVIQGGRDSQGSKGRGGEPPDGKQKQNDPGYTHSAQQGLALANRDVASVPAVHEESEPPPYQEGLEWHLTRVLKRLVDEHGDILVIIDAVDEILKGSDSKSDKGALYFLPTPLPRGVTVLLSCQPDPSNKSKGSVYRELERLQPIKQELPGLNRHEIQEMFPELPPDRVDELDKRTGGNPGELRLLERLDLLESPPATQAFDAQVEVWRQAGESYLETLYLLAMLEKPGGKIFSVEDAHQFVVGRSGNLELSLGAFRRTLGDALANDLEYRPPLRDESRPPLRAESRISLGSADFADHVRKQELGERECRRRAKCIAVTLEKRGRGDDLGRFLAAWPDPEFQPQERQGLDGEERKKEGQQLWNAFTALGEQKSWEAPEATAMVRRAAELGHLEAMRVYANRLIEGRGTGENVEEGRTWLEKAARGKDLHALWFIQDRYFKGNGLPQSDTEGEKWLRFAASAEHPACMAILGDRLIDGAGVERNATEGEDWLRKAMERGQASAASDLAMRLIDGTGLEPNIEEGLRILTETAEGGDADAMWKLGSRLIDGYGLEKDTEEGLRWLEKAARHENPDAILELAVRRLDGVGVPADAEAGESLLRGLAERGASPAIEALIERLETGGIREREDEEVRLWRRRLEDSH